jgi:hypothetical protein
MNVFTGQHGRLRKTEYVIPRDNTSGLCSWDTHVRSRQKKKSVLILGFLVTYISQYFKVPEWEIKLGSYRFLPHAFQLIIHYHPFIRRYVVVVSSTTRTITSNSDQLFTRV